jgi:hypothetical protein
VDESNERGGGLALEMDHSLSAAMTPAHVVRFRSASFVRLITGMSVTISVGGAVIHRSDRRPTTYPTLSVLYALRPASAIAPERLTNAATTEAK